MDVNTLSILAEYSSRKDISLQILRDEIAADDMYCDLAGDAPGVWRVIAAINKKLLDNHYIERAGSYASGIGPETYQISPKGVAALNAEVEIIKKNRPKKPIEEVVNDAIREANQMLGMQLLPLQKKKPRIWLLLAILALAVIATLVIDAFTGSHLLHLIDVNS
jgi:hypothetical protein